MAQHPCHDDGLNWAVLGAGAGLILATLAGIGPAAAGDLRPVPPPPGKQIIVDHTGRPEAGKASIYAHRFDGKKMADGRRYDPQAKVAASRSLPLGTVARVTNLETGRSTEVRIEDRGPFVDGRVVDLTPRAAADIGLSRREGVAPVIVAPIEVPQPDGSLKLAADRMPPDQEGSR